MASQRRSPTDIKREALKEQYNQLMQQYNIVHKEVSYLRGRDQLLKQREAETIYQDMVKVDAELTALDQQSPDCNRQYLILDEHLQKIDFTEVKEVVKTIISQFTREGGNAFFLLQRRHDMAGELCLLQIKAQLEKDSKELKYYPIGFTVDTEPTHIGLLNSLASHFNIEPITDPVAYSSSIQRTIVQSLENSNTIVLIEIHKWDALPPPFQPQVLCWFLEHFWQPLLAQLPTIATTCSKVKFITVLVVENEIASDCLKYCCTHDEFDGQKIIDLPLQDWTEDVILDWLDNQGLSKQRSEALAKYIHQVSKGKPSAVRDALKRENLQNLS